MFKNNHQKKAEKVEKVGKEAKEVKEVKEVSQEEKDISCSFKITINPLFQKQLKQLIQPQTQLSHLLHHKIKLKTVNKNHLPDQKVGKEVKVEKENGVKVSLMEDREAKENGEDGVKDHKELMELKMVKEVNLEDMDHMEENGDRMVNKSHQQIQQHQLQLQLHQLHLNDSLTNV